MIYLKKILNLLIKNGKKGIAIRTLNSTLENLRGNIRGIIPSDLPVMFDKLVPAVKLSKKKVAGKVYQIPTPIKERRAVFQLAKWILSGVESEKKGIKLSIKLGKQLVKTFKGEGVAIAERKKYLQLVKENRSYMRFIKRKRKKKFSKKKWVFKQRFTTKIIKRDIRKSLFDKKNEDKLASQFRRKIKTVRKKKVLKAAGIADSIKNEKFNNKKINTTSKKRRR